MIDVTCAVIRNEEDRVLVVQRGEGTDHPFKWEFPGGKINHGETGEECIIREVREELSMEIVITGLLPATEYDYGFKQIRLIPFLCDTLDDLPLLSEHIDFRWIAASELTTVDFSGADVAVAKNYMEHVLTAGKAMSAPEVRPDDVLKDDKELQAMIIRMMSTKEAEWMAVSATGNPAIFSSLIEYAFSDEPALAFRASWIMTKACDKEPELIYPYLEDIVGRLGTLVNESAIRSVLRTISLGDIGRISVKHHGILAEYCYNQLRSGFSAIAVKAYAMEILYKLVLLYPELKNELVATISILQPGGSAGIVSRSRQILKKLAEPPE